MFVPFCHDFAHMGPWEDGPPDFPKSTKKKEIPKQKLLVKGPGYLSSRGPCGWDLRLLDPWILSGQMISFWVTKTGEKWFGLDNLPRSYGFLHTKHTKQAELKSRYWRWNRVPFIEMNKSFTNWCRVLATPQYITPKPELRAFARASLTKPTILDDENRRKMIDILWILRPKHTPKKPSYTVTFPLKVPFATSTTSPWDPAPLRSVKRWDIFL